MTGKITKMHWRFKQYRKGWRLGLCFDKNIGKVHWLPTWFAFKQDAEEVLRFANIIYEYGPGWDPTNDAIDIKDLDMPLNPLIQKVITHRLQRNNGNRQKTARELGIGERTLYRKIKEYKIKT